MPTTIPYQSDLAIGQIITEEAIENLTHIAALQAPANAAEDQLNALLALKRSIDMTIKELKNMNVDASSLVEEMQNVDAQIKAAAEYAAKKKDEMAQSVRPLQSTGQRSHYEMETPVDFRQSQIQQWPLSADSLRMNCVYIPVAGNEAKEATHKQAITSFINGTIAFTDNQFDASVNDAIQQEIEASVTKQDIAGTLVISITCTQKNAVTIAPLVLDVDKAIHTWNVIFPHDKINADNEAAMVSIASQISNERERSLNLINGATYASCFVGMIHITDEPGTVTTEALRAIAQTLESQFKVGTWMNGREWGIDPELLTDSKKLWSLLPATAYCSIVSLGANASVRSDLTKSANPNIEPVTKTRINPEAFVEAMQEYVSLCVANENGIPVSYYLKPINKQQLVQMWFSKYRQASYENK